MSDHDPLCRRAKIMESLMEGCPECALIVTVRADERAKWSELSRDNWQDGFAQGQRDERAKWMTKDYMNMRDYWLGQAIAAAEGLPWKVAMAFGPIDCNEACLDGPCTCSGEMRPEAWMTGPAAVVAAIKAVVNG